MLRDGRRQLIATLALSPRVRAVSNRLSPDTSRAGKRLWVIDGWRGLELPVSGRKWVFLQDKVVHKRRFLLRWRHRLSGVPVRDLLRESKRRFLLQSLLPLYLWIGGAIGRTERGC